MEGLLCSSWLILGQLVSLFTASSCTSLSNVKLVFELFFEWLKDIKCHGDMPGLFAGCQTFASHGIYLVLSCVRSVVQQQNHAISESDHSFVLDLGVHVLKCW